MRARSLAACTLLAVASVSACTAHQASTHAVKPAGSRSATAPAGTPSAGTPSAGTRPAAAAMGRVTGRAQPCAGLAVPQPSPPMVVLVKAHGVTVALQRLPGGGGTYSIALPPGSYVVSAPRSQYPAQTITVIARQTRTVNFPNRCK